MRAKAADFITKHWKGFIVLLCFELIVWTLKASEMPWLKWLFDAVDRESGHLLELIVGSSVLLWVAGRLKIFVAQRPRTAFVVELIEKIKKTPLWEGMQHAGVLLVLVAACVLLHLGISGIVSAPHLVKVGGAWGQGKLSKMRDLLRPPALPATASTVPSTVNVEVYFTDAPPVPPRPIKRPKGGKSEANAGGTVMPPPPAPPAAKADASEYSPATMRTEGELAYSAGSYLLTKSEAYTVVHLDCSGRISSVDVDGALAEPARKAVAAAAYRSEFVFKGCKPNSSEEKVGHTFKLKGVPAKSPSVKRQHLKIHGEVGRAVRVLLEVSPDGEINVLDAEVKDEGVRAAIFQLFEGLRAEPGADHGENVLALAYTAVWLSGDEGGVVDPFS